MATEIRTSDPPGVTRPPELTEHLEQAYAARGADYAPRTQLTREDGTALYVNRLILEASPYLVQHAHNPVDWRPWSPETLAEAAALDRPIFLSVGYATCHWCHVMEEESFDNEAVAQILNTHFIAVKIDREQRPDLDQIFITATQLQQGHAGWPNSVFLLPDGRPFHTGTYFPRPQFIQILQAVAQAWRGGKRAEIEGVAAQLSAAIQRFAPAELVSAPPPGEVEFAAAVNQLGEMHNALEGGFSNSQQFPQESFLLFLIDHWRRTGDAQAMAMFTASLEAIAAGGIHDHAGGGFHRYTIDPNWRTPHFEKMLYNQGQLARAFLEGWEATGNPAWRRAAERTFAYVLRDMTDAEGAFFTAEDADSRDASGELEEGAFYVWRPADAEAALGEDAAYAVETLGLTETPTLEAGPVAHLDPTAGAPDFARLDPLLERLREARDARARPLRDEKIIAGWNGLMIRALAEGAVAFQTPAYAEAAARAAETLWTRLWTGERLMRLWAAGTEARALEDGTLDDYAWLGLGLLALYDATGDDAWRDRATALARTALTRFGDGKGRLKMAAADGPTGPVYDTSDGATPSGESAMLELLARLAGRLSDPKIRAEAERLRGALSGQLSQAPLLRPDALVASRIMEAGESTARRTLAGGKLRAHLAEQGQRMILEIAPGWHLNAHDPGPDWLIGAALEGAETTWPEGTEIGLGFSEDRLKVYEGRIDLGLIPAADQVSLTVQVCSDSLCLEPETATFRLR